MAETAALLARLDGARAETDRLFQLVNPEAIYDRPIPERNRILFYIGHIEAFDWNLLQPRLPGLAPFDAALDRLFAFGIDPVDGELPSDQPGDWPSRPQVDDYCRRVRTGLDDALGRGLRGWGGDTSPETLLHVAIEHRLMHAETLSYMLHQLPYAAKRKVDNTPAPTGVAAAGSRLIEVPAGQVALGLERGGGVFGWDNEFERTVVDVPAFRIDRYKVTNGQFLEFVRAGGYQDRALWSEEGWIWRQSRGIKYPVFWKPLAGSYLYRGMFEETPLPLDWPVWVSHAEASAYASWKGMRLPTEAEWQRAVYTAPGDSECPYPWGAEAPQARHGYFAMSRWDPAPVNAFPAAASHWGVEGALSGGWEWTSTVFEPLPGFEPYPCYPGYSADFFDGKHFVMKGGSPRTEACMLRRSYRNWFQPHYQYVYAGFRCASQ